MEHHEFHHYLRNLTAFKTSISRGVLLLRQLTECEESLIESFTLRAREFDFVSSGIGYDTDRFHHAIRENCHREKEELDREKHLILSRIRKDKSIVDRIENAIFTLPEPMREICILRYIDQLFWNDIKKETGRSAAGIFKIHKTALRLLEEELCMSQSESLRLVQV